MLDDVEYFKAPSCTFQNVFRFCSHKIVMLICACATKDVFKTMFTPKLFNNLLHEYVGSIVICILFCIVFPVPFCCCCCCCCLLCFAFVPQAVHRWWDIEIQELSFTQCSVWAKSATFSRFEKLENFESTLEVQSESSARGDGWGAN